MTPPPPPLPSDLVIDRIFLTNDPIWAWNVEVRNAGAGPAAATQTGISRAGNAEVLMPTPALAPGASTIVTIECPYGSLGDAVVRADATDLAAESNEANNTSSYTGGGTAGRCRYP